jgi:hypothetical protein
MSVAGFETKNCQTKINFNMKNKTTKNQETPPLQQGAVRRSFTPEEIKQHVKDFCDKWLPKREKYCDVCKGCNCKNNDSCIHCGCQF